MSAYHHINGVIHCDSELSEDITKIFSDVVREDEYWHRNDDGDYLFSLSVKECRVESVMAALSRLAKIMSKDPVDDEWCFVDGVVTFECESADLVCHVKFAAGEASQLISVS